MLSVDLDLARFAVRAATIADADAIARVHAASWRTSYRGILPDHLLDRIDVGQRAASRRAILRDGAGLHLVAHDTTHHDIVGFCDAGPSRRPGPWQGEIYAIYLAHHAKRHGLGAAMLERALAWFGARGDRAMVIWVLENNAHARRFYEAQGGRLASRLDTRVGGHPVVELAYLWQVRDPAAGRRLGAP